jgi:hypothetical protein
LNAVLVQTIANLAAFLEFSPESDVRLEVAVQQLEEMGFQLQRLDSGERTEFSRLIREFASTRNNDQERSFFENFPSEFGLE